MKKTEGAFHCTPNRASKFFSQTTKIGLMSIIFSFIGLNKAHEYYFINKKFKVAVENMLQQNELPGSYFKNEIEWIKNALEYYEVTSKNLKLILSEVSSKICFFYPFSDNESEYKLVLKIVIGKFLSNKLFESTTAFELKLSNYISEVLFYSLFENRSIIKLKLPLHINAYSKFYVSKLIESKSTYLEELNLDGSLLSNTETLNHFLHRSSVLKTLILSNCSINEDGLVELFKDHQCLSLEYLDLSNTKISTFSSDFQVSLLSLYSLKSLMLRGNKFNKLGTIINLFDKSSIETIDLTASVFDDIESTIKELREISVVTNTKIKSIILKDTYLVEILAKVELKGRENALINY